MVKFERLLISILWINAVIIAAMWIFNLVFGFNLFSAGHWQYLSELQLAGKVDFKFYIFTAAFVVAGLAGLYMLIVPWHRRIKIISAGNRPIVGNTESLSVYKTDGVPAAASASPTDFTRPPKLNLNNVFIPTKRETVEIPRQAEPERIVADVRPAARPEIAQEITGMLGAAGFVSKTAPVVGGVRLDFWAVGSDEALVVGLVCHAGGGVTAAEGGDSMWRANGREFKSPVWEMTGVVQKLRALFLEVIDTDLQINILPFVFVDGAISGKDAVQDIWDALGVKVFDDSAVLGKFLDEHRPRRINESEKDDLDAFSEFIDSVAGYFNGTS